MATTMAILASANGATRRCVGNPNTLERACASNTVGRKRT
jgi:hypothetical protein